MFFIFDIPSKVYEISVIFLINQHVSLWIGVVVGDEVGGIGGVVMTADILLP